MKRVAIFTTACLVFLACFTIHLTDGAGIPLAREDGTAKTRASKPTVTVVFRGLMVLHPDPAREYFEAGMLPAPGHRFRIEVRETTASGVSSFSVPVDSPENLINDIWAFEFPSSMKRGVSLYQSGAFDRQASTTDPRDFRWALDLEGREFYNEELPTKPNQLGPIVRLTNGEFYTKTRGRPLMRSQGNNTFHDFGSAADEIAADFIFTGGQVVLRSAATGREIVKVQWKPETTYEIVIQNQPLMEEHAAAISAYTDHFRYYYQLIAKPNNEWYAFRFASDGNASENVRLNHVRFVHPAMEPDPFKCGGVILGKRQEPLL
jgi:hypothetical protein